MISGKIRGLVSAAFFTSCIYLPGVALSEVVVQKSYTPEFGRDVGAYLLDNPEVVLEVFTLLEAQERQKKTLEQASKIGDHTEALFQSADARKGNPDGKVVVVEFFDYACGYCKAALPELTQALEGRDDVAVVLKEFPILGAPSEKAARIAMAVRAEHGDEAYVGFHNALLAQNGSLNEIIIETLAGAAGYDFQALTARGNASDITETLNANKRLAQAMAINGTPAFVFEDDLVGGMMTADRLTATFDRIAANKPD